jgi:hypothetical protein
VSKPDPLIGNCGCHTNNPHSHWGTDDTADEDAYRRGFQHGAVAMRDAIMVGTPAHELKRWLSKIYGWRFQTSHRRRMEPPRAPHHEARPHSAKRQAPADASRLLSGPEEDTHEHE